MTDSKASTAILSTLLDVAKIKAIKAALGGERITFDTDESGLALVKADAHLQAALKATESFYDLPVIIAPIAPDASRVFLATLGQRDKESKVNGIKAIIAYSAPTVQEFLESEEAKPFVHKLIEREASDVIFGNLRGDKTLSELQTAVAGLPVTVSEIVSTSRESGNGLDSDAFDTLWTPFRNGFLKEKAKALYDALPQKNIVLRAIRSKSYALANPQTMEIEARGHFAKIAALMIQLAPTFKDGKGNPAPVDASSIQDWLDNRDTLNIAYNPETTKDFSGLDSVDLGM